MFIFKNKMDQSKYSESGLDQSELSTVILTLGVSPAKISSVTEKKKASDNKIKFVATIILYYLRVLLCHSILSFLLLLVVPPLNPFFSFASCCATTQSFLFVSFLLLFFFVFFLLFFFFSFCHHSSFLFASLVVPLNPFFSFLFFCFSFSFSVLFATILLFYLRVLLCHSKQILWQVTKLSAWELRCASIGCNGDTTMLAG